MRMSIIELALVWCLSANSLSGGDPELSGQHLCIPNLESLVLSGRGKWSILYKTDHACNTNCLAIGWSAVKPL